MHPIAALQTEYSLWTRDPEDELLPSCRELGIAFVAYSPLGRGFLTGRFRTLADIPDGDWRRNNPRFQGENFQKNLDLVRAIEAIARAQAMHAGAARAGVAAARARTSCRFPDRRSALASRRTPAPRTCALTADEVAELERIAPPGAAAGMRYPAAGMATVNR